MSNVFLGQFWEKHHDAKIPKYSMMILTEIINDTTKFQTMHINNKMLKLCYAKFGLSKSIIRGFEFFWKKVKERERGRKEGEKLEYL